MKTLKYLVMLTLLSTLNFACEEFDEVPFEVYRIEAGKHQSTTKIMALQTKGIHFQARFNESAIYTTEIAENQYDINKLLGFSDCNSHHHENSARFGWRWADDELQIFAYVYSDGERIMEYLGSVPLNETVEYQLLISDDFYAFSINGGEPRLIKRANNCNAGFYYMLFPYFGGNEKAPHDIDISVRMLW